MPAYHSAFNDGAGTEVCGLAILPLRGKVRGPAPVQHTDEEDIIDESIRLFRANVLFKNFEVKGAADRTLLYLTIFIHQCLKKVERLTNKADALRTLSALASGSHILPGEPGWPLSGFIPVPKPGQETEVLKNYLRQLREATALRLVDRVFDDAQPGQAKWWLQFAKRKPFAKEFP